MAQTPSTGQDPKVYRTTNQLQYLSKTIMKAMWRHAYSWPFHEPVDAVKLNLPVSTLLKYNTNCVHSLHCKSSLLILSSRDLVGLLHNH